MTPRETSRKDCESAESPEGINAAMTFIGPLCLMVAAAVQADPAESAPVPRIRGLRLLDETITRLGGNGDNWHMSWANDDKSFYETNPDLATAYALLALSYCKK